MLQVQGSLRPLCGVDETENVVEDEVAASAVGAKLESLGVAHGALLLVDLHNVSEQVGPRPEGWLNLRAERR